MFNVGGGEVLVILLIALIVLGPDKLPNAARQAGKHLGDFRRMSNGFQRELRDAMDLNDLTGGLTGTPKAKPTSPGGPTAQPVASPSPSPTAAAASTAAAPETGDRGDDATDRDPATPTNGSGTNGTTSNGSGTNGTTSNGSGTNGSGTNGATVRKRSIEVDGPSASFG